MKFYLLTVLILLNNPGRLFAAEDIITEVQCGDFVQIYNQSLGEDKEWYINDHCFIQDEYSTWHLFGITHEEPANPLEEINFAHATSDSLLKYPWIKQIFALTVSTEPPWDETHVWAPHVILHNGIYYMYYCAGGKDNTKYKIHLATSTNLKTWTRHPQNPMIVDGYDARDPFILRLEDRWVMYYTATRPANKGNHVVMAATSDDLVNWKDKRVVFKHPQIGTYGGPTESPFVAVHNEKYYLFVCTNSPYDDTAVYSSDSPFEWSIKNKVGKIPAHCAEVFSFQIINGILAELAGGEAGST